MSEASSSEYWHSEDLSCNNHQLQEVLKTCANIQSLESLCTGPPLENDFNDVYIPTSTVEKMISTNTYSLSGFISNSSCGSEDGYTDIVLEEDSRLSLAYENLCTLPRRLVDKFGAQTKFLDLSYNNFQNLKFLAFFDELHTLILDRNNNLDVNTLPCLPKLKILWINNCNIYNITDWIHRIELQCTSLEQLSCMGNPGIETVFKDHGSDTPATYAREYILKVLPNLNFVDGIPRYAFNKVSTMPTTLSANCMKAIGGERKESTSASDRSSNRPTNKFTTLMLKEMFRLKPAKERNCINISSSN